MAKCAISSLLFCLCLELIRVMKIRLVNDRLEKEMGHRLSCGSFVVFFTLSRHKPSSVKIMPCFIPVDFHSSS
jgi:hypothetical protein